MIPGDVFLCVVVCLAVVGFLCFLAWQTGVSEGRNLGRSEHWRSLMRGLSDEGRCSVCRREASKEEVDKALAAEAQDYLNRKP